ncbi:hypothetical protein J14TS2_16230 [Bacillus sp. J14TS2]|uniref:sigma factor-like helix-turn-helix DNA-binding protein n=1 Tax=Bacillus sp. J14TS2 TaxID=2807188 RepID=UPI001B2222EB|nr:sigma factor-like helix-turn-helix DNA-binding protein [Bacillus sp. J14TS2]GIN71148.1 hypothetical protein J14TS2_16230 [Bacillus sp. J14TS2]
MWADKMIIQYEGGRRELGRMKQNLGDSDLDRQDKKHINSMISDMSFALDWMKTGRRPGNLRGIDRRSVYQRTALVDMELMPSLDITPEPRDLENDEKQALMNILIDLSHRERQCYLLHMSQGWSMQEIADELNIKKPTVQKFIERAKNKIKRKLSCHTNVI